MCDSLDGFVDVVAVVWDRFALFWDGPGMGVMGWGACGAGIAVVEVGELW